MRKIFSLILIFNLFLLSFGENLEVSQKTKIVVIPFSNMSDFGYNVGEKLSSNISSKLAEMGRFEVIDRMELGKIIEEQKLSQTGLINPEEAVEIGKIAGAKLAFTGNIVSLNVYREEIIAEKTSDLGIIKIKKEEKVYKKEWNAKIVVNVKLIDVETNVTLKSFTQDAFYTTKDIHTRDAAIDGAIALVTENIMYNVRDIFAIKSYIISKQNDRAIIRLGQDMGIKKEMEFFVFGKDEIIKDKFSNLELKKEGKKKGLIIIEKVDANSAEGRIVRGAREVSEGDIIKEKIYMSINSDISLGVEPFKMDAVKARKIYANRAGTVTEYFYINFEQDKMEKTFYINWNLSPAYRNIKPTLDLNLAMGSFLTMTGLDLNLEFAKDLFEKVEFGISGGIGGKYVFGKAGTVKIDRNNIGGVYDVLFDTGSELKDGADINLVGFTFNLKAKARMNVEITEGVSVFGEYGYNIGSIDGWELETKNIRDEDVKIGNANIGKLDLTGSFIGGGIRFTF